MSLVKLEDIIISDKTGVALAKSPWDVYYTQRNINAKYCYKGIFQRHMRTQEKLYPELKEPVIPVIEIKTSTPDFKFIRCHVAEFVSRAPWSVRILK